MAVIAITDVNLRREDMEGAVAGTANIGSGPGPGTNIEVFLQGIQSWGRRINATATDHGFSVTVGTVTDMTAADQEVWMAKIQLLNKGVIDSGGIKVRIGHTVANFYMYIIHDDGTQGDAGEFLYPVLGGFVVQPIDPNIAAWIDGITGAPDLTIVDVFACTGSIAATSNAANLFIDAIDIGRGLYLVGGDGGNTDGLWQDFIDDDEGTATAGRFGHVSTREGVIFLFGGFIIGRNASGSVLATIFSDANQTIVFPGGRVDAGWNKIEIDLGDTGTAVIFTTSTFIGRGRNDLKRFFDTELEVGTSLDHIQIPNHGFLTGDAVTYSLEGGSESIGFAAGLHFVEVIDSDQIVIHSGATVGVGRQNALTSATPLNLTPSTAGNGENHSFTRTPDTRPDLLITSTLGTFLAEGCAFNAFRQIIGRANATFNACTIGFSRSIVQNLAVFSGCTFEQPTVPGGEAYIDSDDPELIDDCIFNSGEAGHALKISVVDTYELDGNSFNNYGTNRAQFSTQNGIASSLEEITTDEAHQFTTGDKVYYNNEGDSTGQAIGLTQGDPYYVNVIDSTTLSMHISEASAIQDTNRINLTASASPDETHSLYSANAAIFNDSGGSVILNIVNSPAAPTIRNGLQADTTVNLSVNLTINVEDEDGQPIFDAQVWIRSVVDPFPVLMNESTNTSGQAVEAFNFTSELGVDIRIRKSSPGDTRYFPAETVGTIISTGLTLTITMVEDTTA